MCDEWRRYDAIMEALSKEQREMIDRIGQITIAIARAESTTVTTTDMEAQLNIGKSLKTTLYRIILPTCGYRGPVWSTLPLNIITISFFNHYCLFYVYQFT